MPQEKKDWRALCAAAAEENDSEKVFELTKRLIAALDECESKRRPSPARSTKLPRHASHSGVRG